MPVRSKTRRGQLDLSPLRAHRKNISGRILKPGARRTVSAHDPFFVRLPSTLNKSTLNRSARQRTIMLRPRALKSDSVQFSKRVIGQLQSGAGYILSQVLNR